DGDPVTRVWYPHGDTKRADTLKLGVRRYGFHLGLLCEHLGFQNEQWRSNVPDEEVRTAGRKLYPHSRASYEEEDSQRKTSWVDVFLKRSLVFVGCGLGPDEWSLWWLLRNRSRIPKTPPAYFAHVGPCDGTIASLGPAVGLWPVSFKSYEQLWGTV